MAGVARWTGTTDAIITNAGNTATVSGTPADPPGAGDTLIFDERSSISVISGSLTGLTEVDIRPGYRGNFGSPANIVTLSATTVKAQLSGTFYWTCSATSFTLTGTGGGGTLWLSGGTITTFTASDSTINIGASVVITNYRAARCNAVISYNATAFTDSQIVGGFTTIDRSMTTALLDNAARVIMTGVGASGNLTGTLTVTGGSTYNQRSSGTCTTANLLNGIISCAGSSYSFTISALNGPMAGTTLVKTGTGGVAITVSSDNRYGPDTGGGPGGFGA